MGNGFSKVMCSMRQLSQRSLNGYKALLPPANEVWGKVIFLHLSVILFTGGVVSQHALQVVSQHALQQVSGGGGGGIPCSGIPACIAGGGLQTHTWGDLQAHIRGQGSPGPHPGGLQAHTWEGGLCIPACTEATPPMDGYCSGWYASYWNAFLFPICVGIDVMVKD